MNTELMHALQIARYECARAMDAVQIDQPISERLLTALRMLDEELSSESFKQRVLAAKPPAPDRTWTKEDAHKAASKVVDRKPDPGDSLGVRFEHLGLPEQFRSWWEGPLGNQARAIIQAARDSPIDPG